MLSILVGHSYYLRLDQKQWQRAKPYPPLATLQVAASLRAAGHAVTLFDATLAERPEDFAVQLRRDTPQVALLYEDHYNFRSTMCLSSMRAASYRMIASARRAGARVIVACSDACDAAQAYLAAGAEVVLIGEGLATLRALVTRLNSCPQLPVAELIAGVTGVASTNCNGLAVTDFKALPAHTNAAALPAWDLLDVERYRALWRAAHGFFSLNIAASRGGPFRNNGCAKPISGYRYLQRPAAEVAAEMTYLKHTFNPDHIWFADDIFGLRVDWVSDFSAAVQATHGSIPFTIQTRADLVSAATARALQDAQCREVWLAAQSGARASRDAMNKDTQLEDISAAQTHLAAQNIRVGLLIQLGYPGEELEDILATRRLLDAAHPDDIGVSVSYPLPSTKFYELLKEQPQEKTHWQQSTDLEMMFEGTYAAEFYRAIRDLLHDQVSVEKLNRRRRVVDYKRERRSLERRWARLISDEQRFRARASSAEPIN